MMWRKHPRIVKAATIPGKLRGYHGVAGGVRKRDYASHVRLAAKLNLNLFQTLNNLPIYKTYWNERSDSF